MNTEFIMIHGGQPKTPVFCERSGWYYGVQFGYKSYAPCKMLDYVQGDWQTYLQALQSTGATQAVVADFRERDEYKVIHKRMVDVAAIGVTPIVVAKFHGSLRLIPEYVLGIKSRVGLSVPTGHMNDGFLPDIAEFKAFSSVTRDLHLLGGHPDQWLYLKKYYADVADTVSIDGNTMYRHAFQYGKMWSRNGYYHEFRGQCKSTNAMTIASMRNAVRYFERGWLHTSNKKPSKRVINCQQQLGLIGIQKTFI